MPALAEHRLPEGPDRIFRLAEPLLTRMLGRGSYQLGGGTALAAAWGHRRSTDIDLFMESAAYRVRMNSRSARQQAAEALREALDPLGPERVDVERGCIKAICREGELGLYTPPIPLEGLIEAAGKVSGTDVALERPAVILARKIHGRMLHSGVFLMRDLYDIAAASVLARDDLEMALRSVKESDRELLREDLRLLPGGWSGGPGRGGSPLIRPRRPAALAQAPGRCVSIAQELCAGDWSWADQVREDASSAPGAAPGGPAPGGPAPG